MNIIVESSWIKVKEEFIKDGKKLIVIGSSDSGKSTFIFYMLKELFKKGKKVGILDLDIGQSNIGPPGTIGFGIIDKDVNSLNEIEPKKIFFIGSVSPKGNFLQIIVGAYKLIKEMENMNLDYILIDTTGLVDGYIAEVLKYNKIEILNPNFIVIFEKDKERENLIKPFLYDGRKIFRLIPSGNVVERSRLERIEYRNKRFKDYFMYSKRVEIHFKESNIIGYDLKKFIPPKNSIVGLLDKDRFLICLGILESINIEKNFIMVLTPTKDQKNIKFIKFSNLIYLP